MGQVGFCKNRMSMEGKLYTRWMKMSLRYLPTLQKAKQLFHFWLASLALTKGTWSCNFMRAWCQDYDISKVSPNPSKANHVAPEKFVKSLKNGAGRGIPSPIYQYKSSTWTLARWVMKC